jgi:hypothetical protein
MHHARLLLLLGLAAATAACASAQAKPAAPVALQIPDPPPRAALDPVPLPEESPAEPPAPPVAVNPPTRTPPRQRPSTPQQPPPTAATATPQPSVPAATMPAPELRPSGSGGESLSGKEVKEIIDRTSAKLGALDRRRLSPGQQADYDSARRFLTQAQEAAKANNLLLAQSAAEKAETLADGLR